MTNPLSIEFETREEIDDFLSHFPPIDFAFAYGSAAFPQTMEINDSVDSELKKQERSLKTQTQEKSKMFDFIFSVECTSEWHAKNLELNPSHYKSFLSYFGGNAISIVSEKVGIGVYFNPMVKIKNKIIKYGVVNNSNLKNDLLTWKNLYIGGRMQKPIFILKDVNKNLEINKINLNHAFNASLLLLPPSFSEEDLYKKICSLSYDGDIRMYFAEDKHKVSKIVNGNFFQFREIYNHSLLQFSDFVFYEKDKRSPCSDRMIFYKDPSLLTQEKLISQLPINIRNMLTKHYRIEKHLSPQEFANEMMQKSKGNFSPILAQCLSRTVLRSSVRQAFCGVMSSGGLTSLDYISRKIHKAFLSWKQ